MMMLRTAGTIARVGLGVLGMGLTLATALKLAPAGCRRGGGQQLTTEPGRPALFRSVVVGGPVWEAARVARVLDGDTYEVLVAGSAVRLRLLGVDAPEHDQAFGQQTTDSVRALLLGRLVRVQRVKTDLYGRTLGHLVLPLGGVAFDSLLVVRGWAWAFDPERATALRAAQQQQAEAGSRGLWKCGVNEAVPPKLWRSFNAQNKRRYLGGCTW